MVSSRLRSVGKMDGMKMSAGFLKMWRVRVASAALMGVAAATTASASTFGFTGAFALAQRFAYAPWQLIATGSGAEMFKYEFNQRQGQSPSGSSTA